MKKFFGMAVALILIGFITADLSAKTENKSDDVLVQTYQLTNGESVRDITMPLDKVLPEEIAAQLSGRIKYGVQEYTVIMKEPVTVFVQKGETKIIVSVKVYEEKPTYFNLRTSISLSTVKTVTFRTLSEGTKEIKSLIFTTSGGVSVEIKESGRVSIEECL